MIKKIILISLGIIVLIVCGFAVYVSNMDWNGHKSKIETEISNLIGEKVELGGDLQVSLFPHPNIKATDINIINQNNLEKLAFIKTMQTEVSLRSLLHKTPDIESLALNGVEIWYKADENGVSNWHQDKMPAFITADIDSRLQSFSLQNSIIHIDNEKYAFKADLSNFNVDIHAASLSGPYRLDGNFIKDDNHFGIALSIGSLMQPEDIGLTFAITHPDSNSYLRYDGIYNADEDYFKGSVSGSSDKSADFVKVLFEKDVLESQYNIPFIFSVEVEATHFTA